VDSFVGELDNPNHHNEWELLAAVVVVNLIATVLKFGDRSQIGAVLLSTSLVAMLQLIAAAPMRKARGQVLQSRGKRKKRGVRSCNHAFRSTLQMLDCKT
jgi:hypothetical protein